MDGSEADPLFGRFSGEVPKGPLQRDAKALHPTLILAPCLLIWLILEWKLSS